MTIEFGDWRLVPVDSRNWELCHRHVTTRGKNVGKEQWHHLGRYYQYNTIPAALEFAADEEMKAKRHGEVVRIEDALREYERILGEFRQAVSAR